MRHRLSNSMVAVLVGLPNQNVNMEEGRRHDGLLPDGITRRLSHVRECQQDTAACFCHLSTFVADTSKSHGARPRICRANGCSSRRHTKPCLYVSSQTSMANSHHQSDDARSRAVMTEMQRVPMSYLGKGMRRGVVFCQILKSGFLP